LCLVEAESPVTGKQLASMGRRWQRRLRLADWRVAFAFADLPPDTLGQVESDADAREATVSIARRCDDIEGTVVHELLHLHFDAPAGTAQEQAINAVADALLGRK
jgi:hypothetical protein